MTIVVNPHNKEEELALLAFLDRMEYDYSKEEDAIALSESQKKQIIERDKEYEEGKADTLSLQDIIAHFNIKE